MVDVFPVPFQIKNVPWIWSWFYWMCRFANTHPVDRTAVNWEDPHRLKSLSKQQPLPFVQQHHRLSLVGWSMQVKIMITWTELVENNRIPVQIHRLIPTVTSFKNLLFFHPWCWFFDIFDGCFSRRCAWSGWSASNFTRFQKCLHFAKQKPKCKSISFVTSFGVTNVFDCFGGFLRCADTHILTFHSRRRHHRYYRRCYAFSNFKVWLLYLFFRRITDGLWFILNKIKK